MPKISNAGGNGGWYSTFGYRCRHVCRQRDPRSMNSIGESPSNWIDNTTSVSGGSSKSGSPVGLLLRAMDLRVVFPANRSRYSVPRTSLRSRGYRQGRRAGPAGRLVLLLLGRSHYRRQLLQKCAAPHHPQSPTAVYLLHQYRTRHDDPARRPRRRAGGRRDRRRRDRCLRGGAAAARAPALDDAGGALDAAHRGLRPLSRRAALRRQPRQLPPLSRRRRIAQPGRQGAPQSPAARSAAGASSSPLAASFRTRWRRCSGSTPAASQAS
jgi:hypothetical protein